MKETVSVVGHTRTVNGKLVWIPQHQTTVQHSLDEDFEDIQGVFQFKQALKEQASSKIPADLDADFEELLPSIQSHAPKPEPPKLETNAYTMGQEAFNAGMPAAPIANKKLWEYLGSLPGGLSGSNASALMKLYNAGYTQANLAAAIPDVSHEPEPPEESKTVNLQWTPKVPSYIDILHNNGENHDKVYKVAVVEGPDGKFHVVAQWGKTGKSLTQAEKGAYNSYAQAKGSCDKLLLEKKAKGYHKAQGHAWHATEFYPWQPVTITVPKSTPKEETPVPVAQPAQETPKAAPSPSAPSSVPGPGITAWKTGTPSGTSIQYGDGLWVMTKHVGVDEELRIGGPDATSDKVKAAMEAIGAKWMPIGKVWKVSLNGKPWASGKNQTHNVHMALTVNGFYPNGSGGPTPITVPMATTQIPIGTTKMENGKIYVLNRNHKWELQEKTEHPDEWKKIGPQKGSNPGGLFQESTGKKWYVKTLKSEAHAKNEILAAKLYQEAGLDVPNLKLIQKDGKASIASEWKEGLTQPDPAKAGKLPGTMDGFVVDAWLCNRDSVGEDFTNLVQGPDGKAYRVDVGGSLIYRAQGGDKPGFGNEVDELASMLDPAINKQTSTVYKGITQKDLEAGAARVLAISDQTIKDLVEAHGPGTSSDKAALVAKLIARKYAIGKAFPGAAKKVAFGWVTLGPGEQVVEHGEEYGVKWAKVRVPPGGFKPNSIPTPPAISASQSIHFNAANTAAAKLVYDTAMGKGTPEQLQALEIPEVSKDTGAPTGKMIKLTEHPSQHVKNYLTSVTAEVKAQHESTYKTEYNGSFTGSYNTIAAKLAGSFKAKAHTEFSGHHQKAADYLILNKSAAESVPVPKMGFKEKSGSDLNKYKEECIKNFSVLSEAEKKAAGAYTGSAYSEWNEKLRAGTIPNGAKPMISAFNKAATELPEGTILWRGIGVGGDTYKSVVGAIIQDGSFQSTSYGDHPAFSHKQTWLRLHIGKGVKAIQAAGVFSHFGTGEAEIVLPPNCRYAVLKVTDEANMTTTSGSKHGKKTIVDILVLPNDDVVAKESAA
jgi:predicted DNA-binding WGR domain protein